MNNQTANEGQKNPNGFFIENTPTDIPPAGNRLVSALSKQQRKFAAAGGSLFRKNKDRKKEYYKKRYQAKKLEIRSVINERDSFNLRSWWEIIPQKTKCQICGKEIFFNKKNPNNAIHFDHKNENSSIEIKPYYWLRRHKRTPENQKIWESCNFGMLCRGCNWKLPTKNRRKYIRRIFKYVFNHS